MEKYKLQKKWQKDNMKQIKATFKTEFVNDFKNALEILDLKQSDIIRQAMQDVIDNSKK